MEKQKQKIKINIYNPPSYIVTMFHSNEKKSSTLDGMNTE